MSKSNGYRIVRKMPLYLPHSTELERAKALEKLQKMAGNEVIHKCMLADLDWRKSPRKPDLERLTLLIQKTSNEMLLRKKRTQAPPHSQYRKIWRIIDGAVKDALYKHPDYLTPKGRVSARESIVKRATGAVKGFIKG